MKKDCSDYVIDNYIPQSLITKKNAKKIAFDLHGVLEVDVDGMKNVISWFHFFGFKVGVISGPPTPQILEELDNLGYVPLSKYFDFVYSIVDFLHNETNAEMWQDNNGNWWTDDYSWWSSKGKICEMYGIDMLIDDKKEYAIYMPKRTDFHDASIWCKDIKHKLDNDLIAPYVE